MKDEILMKEVHTNFPECEDNFSDEVVAFSEKKVSGEKIVNKNKKQLFNCLECDKTFRDKFNLNSHHKKFHRKTVSCKRCKALRQHLKECIHTYL